MMTSMSLREAIVAGSVPQVRESCRGGADVEGRFADGETPLTFAVGVAGVPVIRALLAAFADPTLKNMAGADALERAVTLKRKNVFNLLAPRFDRAHVADAERRMPYFVKPPATPRDESDPFANHPAMVLKRAVQESIEAGPRVPELVTAALEGDVATVRRLLADGVNPDAMDANRPGKETALDMAMLRGQIEIIAALAAAGADLDRAPIGADCPMLVAIGWGRIDVLRALGEGGADLTKSNRRGVTPLDFARQKRNADAEQELLRMGADRLRGPDDALPMPPPLAPYEFVPPPPPANRDKPPPGQSDFVGLPTADVISCGLLVQAEVGATASALFNLIDGDVHHPNAIGLEVSALDTGYVVWRLAGHAWTAVTQLDFMNGVLTPAHAAALAKQLNVRAIFIRICDTAGSGEYALFDDCGVVQEVFEQNDGAEWLKESHEIAAAVAERFRIDMSPLAARMTFDRAISFGSTLRDLTADGVGNPWTFFNQFLVDQRALSPSAWCDGDGFEPGGMPRTLRLVTPEENFGYDAAFERVDYVASSGRAAATSP
jgi:ankyrin repeat protein